MKTTETIKYQQQIIAYIIRPKLIDQVGSKFFNNENDFIQVGVHQKKSQEQIEPHFNIKQQATINNYQEFILITKGKVKVNFFNNKGKLITSRIISSGEGVILVDGGHGFEFLKKTQLIEVKQGPFTGQSCVRIHDPSK